MLIRSTMRKDNMKGIERILRTSIRRFKNCFEKLSKLWHMMRKMIDLIAYIYVHQ